MNLILAQKTAISSETIAVFLHYPVFSWFWEDDRDGVRLAKPSGETLHQTPPSDPSIETAPSNRSIKPSIKPLHQNRLAKLPIKPSIKPSIKPLHQTLHQTPPSDPSINPLHQPPPSNPSIKTPPSLPNTPYHTTPHNRHYSSHLRKCPRKIFKKMHSGGVKNFLNILYFI